MMACSFPVTNTSLRLPLLETPPPDWPSAASATMKTTEFVFNLQSLADSTTAQRVGMNAPSETCGAVVPVEVMLD